MANNKDLTKNLEKNDNNFVIKEKKANQLKRFKWLFIIIDIVLFIYVLIEFILICRQ